MTTVTQWYDGLPVKPGVWETGIFVINERWFSYWNGSAWGYVCRTPSEAFDWKHMPTLARIVRWRGLADKPEGK